MCVIIVCESRLPTEAEIRNSDAANPHGCGLAWVHRQRVRWMKGLSADDLLPTIRKRAIRLPVVLHFRWASVGGLSPALTHPFPIGKGNARNGTADAVLFHNGTVKQYRTYAALVGAEVGGDESDTLAIARVLAKIPRSRWAGFLETLEGNRWVIMTQRKIEVIGDFMSRDGLLASNSSPWRETTPGCIIPAVRGATGPIARWLQQKWRK